MIFESINYSFALQDFIFSTAAGFAVGFFNQLLSVFFYKGKIKLFIKDMLVCFVFAVVIFSYVISFTNYPIIRIYHLLGGLLGFFCFSFRFSTIFHNFFEKIFLIIKNKMLCLGGKLSTIICALVEKTRKKPAFPEQPAETAPLQADEVLVYNL